LLLLDGMPNLTQKIRRLEGINWKQRDQGVTKTRRIVMQVRTAEGRDLWAYS